MGIAEETHKKLRRRDGLIPEVPAITRKEMGEIVCGDCGNHCVLTEGEIGFCNLRIALDGRVKHRYSDKAVVSWYFDPLPTNCVADWVCQVKTEQEIGSGERRLKNLAVFYGSCNSDCLFCQNASYRGLMAKGEPLMTAQELADVADEFTACVCYFGGDPACNPEHSINTSKLLNEIKPMKVCYETNGNISKKWLDKISKTIETTGGTFKFDLKAVTPQIYKVLTGISNSVVLRNFEELARAKKQREGEFLVASILLIPGYIDIPEVRSICDFIATSDPTIPTALLGYSPHFAMSDLPRTSMAHARAALDVANETGLENVRIGNIGLLGKNNYKFD
ncbi:MAG: radical SAM protein [Candidatus Thorarchaeota archaeon]